MSLLHVHDRPKAARLYSALSTVTPRQADTLLDGFSVRAGATFFRARIARLTRRQQWLRAHHDPTLPKGHNMQPRSRRASDARRGRLLLFHGRSLAKPA